MGPITDGFDDWLAASGFTRGSRKFSIRLLPIVDARPAPPRASDEVAEARPTRFFDDCWKALMKTYPCRAGTVHTLERYLVANGLIVDGRQAAAPRPSTLSEEYVESPS